jgi:hypothetical protein
MEAVHIVIPTTFLVTSLRRTNSIHTIDSLRSADDRLTTTCVFFILVNVGVSKEYLESPCYSYEDKAWICTYPFLYSVAKRVLWDSLLCPVF